MYVFEMPLGEENVEARRLVIFAGGNEGTDREYGDKIDVLLKIWTQPKDEIVFIFPEFLKSTIGGYIDDYGRLVSNITRLGKEIEVHFYSFDGDGKLRLVKTINGHGATLPDPKILCIKIVEHGLDYLVTKGKETVILTAPPGTVFSKPSKDHYREFIKASEMAVGLFENQFVAFCLLTRQPKLGSGLDITEIWIDSSSIGVFVGPLLNYLQRFSGTDERCIHYDSFNSYGGYKKVQPESIPNSWVIISASTSNNLGKEIFKEWKGIKHDQIVTVLSYTEPKVGLDEEPVESGDRILSNISSHSDAKSTLDKFGSEMAVQLVGENFTVQIKEPNRVLLRKPHNTIEVRKFVSSVSHLDSFHLFKKSGFKLRPVYFNSSGYFAITSTSEMENELKNKLTTWFKDVIDWHVPQTSKYVVYNKNDPSACALLSLFQSLVRASEELVLVDYAEAASKVSGSGAVIILTPVISSGRSLLKLNRDFRISKHTGQRIFVAPFAFPSSNHKFKLFKRSLCLGPKELDYQFFNFRHVCVGHQENVSSWERESDTIEGFTSSLWVKRAHLLKQQAVGLTDQVGISFDPSNEKLQFGDGFAYWDSDYDPEKTNHAAVYLTIASVLQGLREKPYSLNDSEALFSHVYQHSIIDPENFSRFTDGLIQSCLWRAANASELDYRSSAELSAVFVDILKRLANEMKNGEFNALPDLLVGIATNKIKLASSEFDVLLQYIKVELSESEAILELITELEGGADVSPPF